MRSAVVTGATGFIGAALVRRLLATGWRTTAIVRASSATQALSHPNLTVHVHDDAVDSLADMLREARADVVFHLASLFLADHRPDQVAPLIASNVAFPARLMEAMRLSAEATGLPARLVTAGTSWQHFGGPAYRPVNLYAATKEAADALLSYYHDAHALSALTLKLYDTYGSGDPRRKLIAILVEAARSGAPLAMSPGDQELVLTHVDDVVDAFLHAADLLMASDRPLRADYLVEGERLTLKQLVTLVGRVAGRAMPVTFGERPYRNREVMVPVQADAATRLPDWQPTRTLERGLAELLA